MLLGVVLRTASRREVVAHLDDAGLLISDGTLPLVCKPVTDLHAGQAGRALDLLDLPMRRIVSPFAPQILQDAQLVGGEDRALRLRRRRRLGLRFRVSHRRDARVALRKYTVRRVRRAGLRIEIVPQDSEILRLALRGAGTDSGRMTSWRCDPSVPSFGTGGRDYGWKRDGGRQHVPVAGMGPLRPWTRLEVCFTPLISQQLTLSEIRS